MKKVLLNIFSYTIWIVVAIYVVIIVLLHIPAVQCSFADRLSDAVSEKLGTKVEIERIDLGFLNRIIIDGFVVFDQNGKRMIKTSRLSAKINPLELINGKIDISSAQIFGLDAYLYRQTPESDMNIQFAIDSLASKDTTDNTSINLRVASLVIRNGAIKYDVNSIPEKHGGLDINHLQINKLTSHIMLYGMNDDDLDMKIKTIAFKEKSGLELKHLGFRLIKDKESAKLSDMVLELPNSHIEIPEVSLSNFYNKKGLTLENADSRLSLHVNKLSFADISPLLPFDIVNLPTMKGNLNVKGSKGNMVGELALSSTDNKFSLTTNAEVKNVFANPVFNVRKFSTKVSDDIIVQLYSLFSLPDQLIALGDVAIDGQAKGTIEDFDANAVIKTSNVGDVTMTGDYNKGIVHASISTEDLNLKALTSNDIIGNISAELDVNGNINNQNNIAIVGDIASIEINNYIYKNIKVNSKYIDGLADVSLSISDENVGASVNGSLNIADKYKKASINLDLNNFSPKNLNLSDKWGDARFDMLADINLSGTGIDDILGNIDITDFVEHGGSMNDAVYNETCNFGDIHIHSKKEGAIRSISINSDIIDAELKGQYSIGNIHNSFVNLLISRLSSIRGNKSTESTSNNFMFSACLKDSYFMQRILGIDIDLHQQVALQGFINDVSREANIYLYVPSADVFGYKIRDGQILLWTPDNTLRTNASLSLVDDDSNHNKKNLSFEADASNNQISSSLSWDNSNGDIFSGTIKSNTRLMTMSDGSLGVNIDISPSDVQLGDSIWHLNSRGISYANDKLTVGHLALENESQHLFINGAASKYDYDSLIVDLKNIDVGYVLDLVNFHSVEFDGFATGRVIAKNLFSTPEASTKLDVNDFKFMEGNMGDLHINANLNNNARQIDIKAFSDDDTGECMTIDGYVSPQREDLYLDIDAKRVNMEFMEYFCKAFLKDIDADGKGKILVYGPFSDINLKGEIVAGGELTVSSLNCRYSLKNDTIRFIPDDILVKRMPIYDSYGNVAYMSGGLHHKHLTRMTYDFNIEADKFLCYNFTDFGESTFYGTAFLSGDCTIVGRSSELNIDVKGDVEEGSKIVYNASSPDAITKQEFITWHSASQSVVNDKNSILAGEDNDKDDVSTNIHMNLLLNVTPESSLFLLMDPTTGDYIDLHGSGVLRASYYNKGTFDLFGNYVIDNGIYKMTIQNVMRREFEFQEGSSITFGGDPYNASLNMQALYTVNSVPLSDLNIGNTFSSNNIRVNCIMNITGTPGMPKVDFSMDMPTVNSEAKQMIYSIINSEEEMNQQVLFLLSVGRFYSQTNNNAGMQDSRSNSTTSLAMQSFLSGTLSQQINNVFSSVIKNQNWKLGANISPGDEGFTNAEYEGLLNGSLFDNRLQFNGQFGYRDNATTAQQGFIGDFDIRYNLTPNGNFAVRVYNQTNDRYFTRNSLNTQGLGLILKKDFNTWKSFFVWRKKKRIENETDISK